MKVLVLSHTSDLIGGAERSMLDTFDYLARHHNVKPQFIIREPLGSLVAEMKRRHWKYYPLKYTFWSWSTKPIQPHEVLQHAKENSSAVTAIQKIIRRTKPDLVMTNTIISPWAALAAHFEKVPHVWFVREFGDLDHGRTFDMSHGDTYRDIGHLSELVVGNSETMIKEFIKYIPKIKTVVLYIPFDVERLKKLAAAKVGNPFKSKDSLKLVMTSNLTRTKGQLEAIEATGILNQAGHDVELCLVGKNVDAQYFAKLEAAITKYKLNNKVHFAGLQSNPLAIVAQADVGIVASRKEAFGRTTFEYLVIGKPVVGANSGATPEMVEQGVNGFLFKPGDSQSLAKALENYIKHPQWLTHHGQVSSQKATKMMAGQHNIEALYQKLQSLAKQLVESKAKINYLNQWPGYLSKDRRSLKTTSQTSLAQKARWHGRQFAKTQYYRARKIKARLTGR